VRESRIEKYLVEQVKLHGGLTRCPDRLVGFPQGPRFALVELKRPLGRARAEQEREHVRLRRVGFDVRVLSTIEAVDAFILEMVDD